MGTKASAFPGPWYGSRPSLDPDWSHEHHLSRVISCAQRGKPFAVMCHQSRRKYCNELCYQAARRNKDRPRIRDYQRIRSRRIARNKLFEAGREERIRSPAAGSGRTAEASGEGT